MKTQFTLTPLDLEKWLHNLIIFLIPVITLYLIQVIATLSTHGHIIHINDLIPSEVTVGGMILYIFNGVLDILRKFQIPTNVT